MPDAAVSFICTTCVCDIDESSVGADTRKATLDGWPMNQIVATDIVSGEW
jgi:hypothetical protein